MPSHNATLPFPWKRNRPLHLRDLFISVCGCTTNCTSLSLEDRPQIHILALISCLRLALLLTAFCGVALNAVPLWVLMTGWIGKWVAHFRKHRKGKGKDKGKRARRAGEKKLATVSYSSSFCITKCKKEH